MLPLTANLQLRTTADWISTANPSSIPVVFGRTTLTPIRYSTDRRQWVISDGSIAGIDQVRIDDVIYSSWEFNTVTDNSGELVSIIILNEPLQDAAILSVDARGRLDESFGTLADSPADVIYWILNQTGGNWTRNDFNNLRNDCKEDGLNIGGIFSDGRSTLRTSIDSVTQSIGAIWSIALPNVVQLYPISSVTSIAWPTPINGLLQLECSHSNLRTAIRVNYDFDYSKSEYRGSVTLSATDAVKRWGNIDTTLDAPWLNSAPAAALVGRRALERLARPLWRLTWLAAGQIKLGTHYAISHVSAPSGLTATVVRTDYDPHRNETVVTAEACAGSLPRISVDRVTSRFPIFIPDRINYELIGTVLTLIIPDPAGAPIVGAVVTLDGKFTQSTNANGRVQFYDVAAGTHTLHVEADGYEPKDYEIKFTGGYQISL